MRSDCRVGVSRRGGSRGRRMVDRLAGELWGSVRAARREWPGYVPWIRAF